MIGGSTLPSRLAFTLVAGAIATALAIASWHLIEARFLSLRRYLPYVRSSPAAPVGPLAEAGRS